jgi:hypothetical protein
MKLLLRRRIRACLLADDGGYATQLILMSTDDASSGTVHYYDNNGSLLAVGRQEREHKGIVDSRFAIKDASELVANRLLNSRSFPILNSCTDIP